MYFLSWVAVNFIVNNLFLYVKYVLRKESQFSYLILVVQVMVVISTFCWSRLSMLIGKKKTYLVGGSQWILLVSAVYVLDRFTPVWIVYLVGAYAGICTGTAYLIPWSLLPDVIDEDELRTEFRREGAFYSIFVLIQRLGLALALASSSWTLGAAGYVAPDRSSDYPDTQDLSVLDALRWMTGPIPGVLLATSVIPMFFYDLGREKVQEIQTKLAIKRNLGDRF